MRILAEFEELSDYENIFTGNNRAEEETKALNERIVKFVVKCFQVPNVKFSKEYNEEETRDFKGSDSEDDDNKGKSPAEQDYVPD